jgi:hypothetical protein
MEHNERRSRPTIDDLRDRRRQAAAQLRYVLQELETAEREFERATRELQMAMEKGDAA